MIVQLQCQCHWSPEKRDRIAILIAERADLILGNSISQLVRDLTFADELPTLSLSQPSRKDIYLDKRSDGTYGVALSSETLFSMVMPGSGQAHFDELMSSVKRQIGTVQNRNLTGIQSA